MIERINSFSDIGHCRSRFREKTRNPRWKVHFEFTRLANERINAFGILCRKNYEDSSEVTSHFLKHLKRLHVREYDRLFFGEQHKGADINEKGKQNRLSSSIVKNLVVKCNFPLNIVENSAFRDFMMECAFKWQSISTKNIKSKFLSWFVDEVRKGIEEKLSGMEHGSSCSSYRFHKAHLSTYRREDSSTNEKHPGTIQFEGEDFQDSNRQCSIDDQGKPVWSHCNRIISGRIEAMEEYEGEYHVWRRKGFCQVKHIDSGWFFLVICFRAVGDDGPSEPLVEWDSLEWSIMILFLSLSVLVPTRTNSYIWSSIWFHFRRFWYGRFLSYRHRKNRSRWSWFNRCVCASGMLRTHASTECSRWVAQNSPHHKTAGEISSVG